MIKLLMNKNDIEIKNRINKELDFLAFKQFHKGTIYLCETICEIYIQKNTNINLNAIYSIIAKKYNTSTNNVKINIFRATLNSYCECEEKKLLEYIGKKIIEKPTNLEIITAILKHIK